MSLPKRGLFALAVIAALLAAMVLLLVAGGFPAGPVLSALWHGSVGSWYAFTSGTMVRAIPLILTGGAVALAFRAGVFNIGVEGQFLAGATAAAAVALALPHAGVFSAAAALLAAALAGAGWAGVAAFLRTRFGVLEVISTIMLNFVAVYAVSYLVRGPLQEPTHIYPQTSTIAAQVQLMRIPGMGRLHVGVFIALIALGVCGWLFRYTAAGFRLLAVGDSPSAARSAGQIDVTRTIRDAFLASGTLAGLAGGVEVLGVTFALYENISPGYGYTAIAVALLAGLDPWRVVLSALLFAVLETGSVAMQRDAGIPSSLVSIIEAVLILAAVGVQALRLRTAQDSVSRVDAHEVIG